MDKRFPIIWLTGLPCSGKTTLANALSKICIVEVLDGDVLRATPFAMNAGFSPEDRKRHLLRVGYLAERLSKYSIVICAFVSPSEEVRQQLPIDVMVYVKCPKEECIRRDIKGMWAKAIRGEIKDFTGVDAEYEEPINPDVIVDTSVMTIEDCVWEVFKYMFQAKIGKIIGGI